MKPGFVRITTICKNFSGLLVESKWSGDVRLQPYRLSTCSLGEVSVLAELALEHLRYSLTGVLPQCNIYF